MTHPRRFPRREQPARTGLAVFVAVLLPAVVGAVLLARSSEERSVAAADRRLAEQARAATVRFGGLLRAAELRARSLAAEPDVRTALAAGDPARLAALAARWPRTTFVAATARVGATPGLAAVRREPVVVGSRTIGRVEALVPLDDALARELVNAAGVGAPERLVLVTGGRVVAGADVQLEPPAPEPGAAREVQIEGQAFRAVAARLASGPRPVDVAVLTPVAGISSAPLGQLVLAALMTALTVALVVGVVLSWRERRRLERLYGGAGRADTVREALALVGDALAATHNPRALYPVVLETTMEATGAVAGNVRERGEDVASAGDAARGGQPIELSLATGDGADTSLVLYPSPRGFTPEERELAEWLAAQAAIALESARLHRLVEQQAVTDELTQLPNRRRFIDALSTELSRAERFGGSVAVVLADLDDFKSVNDRYGHQAGDDVLRAFADVLREQARDVDVAARIGGEEFGIVLPETELEGGRAMASRVRVGLAERGLVLPTGEVLRVTASFGVAAYPLERTQSELLVAADEALYQAKRSGKNRVVAVGSGTG